MKTLLFSTIACAVAAGFAAVQDAPAKKPLPRWCALLDVGPAYDKAKPPMAQPGFAEHLANVNRLAGEGTLLVGGPLFGADLAAPLSGGLWVFEAADEAAAKKLVAADPFVKADVMKVASVRAFMPGAGSWLAEAKPAPAAAR